ncbi:MAG: hypothetical protein R2716_06170 [Microthrixaceae bacterium]
MLKDLRYRLDVNTLHRDEGVGRLELNEIGRATCARPSRSSSTSTAATVRPVRSYSSTRRPTTPSVQG